MTWNLCPYNLHPLVLLLASAVMQNDVFQIVPPMWRQPPAPTPPPCLSRARWPKSSALAFWLGLWILHQHICPYLYPFQFSAVPKFFPFITSKGEGISWVIDVFINLTLEELRVSMAMFTRLSNELTYCMTSLYTPVSVCKLHSHFFTETIQLWTSSLVSMWR